MQLHRGVAPHLPVVMPQTVEVAEEVVSYHQHLQTSLTDKPEVEAMAAAAAAALVPVAMIQPIQ